MSDSFLLIKPPLVNIDLLRLWIIRINIAAKINGISYSKFIFGLKKAKCLINRKVLADLAISDPKVFTEIATRAKKAI